MLNNLISLTKINLIKVQNYLVRCAIRSMYCTVHFNAYSSLQERIAFDVAAFYSALLPLCARSSLCTRLDSSGRLSHCHCQERSSDPFPPPHQLQYPRRRRRRCLCLHLRRPKMGYHYSSRTGGPAAICAVLRASVVVVVVSAV